jgi:hypothetical protein
MFHLRERGINRETADERTTELPQPASERVCTGLPAAALEPHRRLVRTAGRVALPGGPAWTWDAPPSCRSVALTGGARARQMVPLVPCPTLVTSTDASENVRMECDDHLIVHRDLVERLLHLRLNHLAQIGPPRLIEVLHGRDGGRVDLDLASNE